MYFHVKGRIVNSKYQLSLLFIVFMEMYLTFPSEFYILRFYQRYYKFGFFFSFLFKSIYASFLTDFFVLLNFF